jgi:hypothetical protein
VFVAAAELIETIARALVDDPDSVEVVEVEGDRADHSVLELRVAKDDIGKVIGKDGRTAQAIRTVLSAASTRGRRVHLDILD